MLSGKVIITQYDIWPAVDITRLPLFDTRYLIYAAHKSDVEIHIREHEIIGINPSGLGVDRHSIRGPVETAFTFKFYRGYPDYIQSVLWELAVAPSFVYGQIMFRGLSTSEGIHWKFQGETFETR